MITLAQLKKDAEFSYTHEGVTYKLIYQGIKISNTTVNRSSEYIFTMETELSSKSIYGDRFTISIGPGTLTSHMKSKQFTIYGDITAVTDLRFVSQGRGGSRSRTRTRSRKSRRRRHRSVRV